MSAVREYLEEKAAAGPKEWLRREPRETHPDIQALVRRFRSAGGFYDDDAERYVEERIGDLPEHKHHGHPERDPLTNQLGHEVYIATHVLADERAQAVIDAALADGFVALDEADIEEGARYVIRFGTLYSGRTVPDYHEAYRVRARKYGDGFIFLPHRARTKGFSPRRLVLIRPARPDDAEIAA